MKVALAALYGFLLSLLPASLYMLFSIFEASAKNANVNAAISNALLAGCIAWAFASTLIYQLLLFIEEANKTNKNNKN